MLTKRLRATNEKECEREHRNCVEYVDPLQDAWQYLLGRFRPSSRDPGSIRRSSCYSPVIATREPTESDTPRNGPQVELRLWIPREIAEWLQSKAQESFKSRNEYVRDLLVRVFRQEKNK